MGARMDYHGNFDARLDARYPGRAISAKRDTIKG